MGLHLQLLLVLASSVILRSESRGTHDHILLSQIRDSPHLESQVPQEQGVPKIPPGTGFLFVASYDSQSYGGGIRPRLHAGSLHCVSITLKNALCLVVTHNTADMYLDS
jgi:hypothetical protein